MKGKIHFAGREKCFPNVSKDNTFALSSALAEKRPEHDLALMISRTHAVLI